MGTTNLLGEEGPNTKNAIFFQRLHLWSEKIWHYIEKSGTHERFIFCISGLFSKTNLFRATVPWILAKKGPKGLFFYDLSQAELSQNDLRHFALFTPFFYCLYQWNEKNTRWR